MKKILVRNLLIILSLFISMCIQALPDEKKVYIVIDTDAGIQVRKAADQLRTYLEELYPDFHFLIGTNIHEKNHTIMLKTSSQQPDSQQEGFTIHRVNDKKVIMEAGSVKGIFNAVYSLLEKLGTGFYFSYDTKALPKKELNFWEWELHDFPLQGERIVFNWHNFLSGCTGWSYEDWCSWIDQSAKMRYNTVMVHAYGNNPMFSFEYNGLKKAVGYLTTSESGRDWGAQHVNDVRRLPGGNVFSGPVLGSAAALVPEDQRSEAAIHLMSRVFEHARKMAMKINFAIDVDTWSSNPKNIIESLPAACRIRLKEQDIVNPETKEGYQYYKAQLSSLLTSYPQLSTITIWIRDGRSLWNDMTPEQLPESFLNEWRQLLQRHPELERYKHGPSIFLSTKVIKSFQKALKELNRQDVSLAFGSWNLEFVPYADMILPQECPVIFLEEVVNFESAGRKRILSELGKTRKILPVFYGHHDDHRYLGRPYTPFPNFNELLKERKLAGFGLLHWTTRPLDLLFKSLNDQVWSLTENKSLDSTIADYCRNTFGTRQEFINQYVTAWITRGPMFGRETQDHFFDLGKQIFGEKAEPFEVTLEGIKYRTNLLKKVELEKLTETGKKRFNYDVSMEAFYLSLYQNQQSFNRAYSMLELGSLDSARLVLEKVCPEKAIELYARASGILPITPGEKALIVSLGTRWMPDFINLKQRARMAAICYKFQVTRHDSLAQQPGINTYFIDADKRLWSCLGEKELKTGVAGYFGKSEAAGIPENSLTWLKISQALSFPLVTIGKNNLVPGKYMVELKYKSSASEPKLNLISKNSRIPLQPVAKISDHGLNTVSILIEIKETQKNWLEINPEKELFLTNLVIRAIN